MNKKGQGLTLNQVVIAVIILVFLIISLIVVNKFSGKKDIATPQDSIILDLGLEELEIATGLKSMTISPKLCMQILKSDWGGEGYEFCVVNLLECECYKEISERELSCELWLIKNQSKICTVYNMDQEEKTNITAQLKKRWDHIPDFTFEVLVK